VVFLLSEALENWGCSVCEVDGMCVIDEDQSYLGFRGTILERRSGHWDRVVTGEIDQYTGVLTEIGAAYFEGKRKTVLLVSLWEGNRKLQLLLSLESVCSGLQRRKGSVDAATRTTREDSKLSKTP